MIFGVVLQLFTMPFAQYYLTRIDTSIRDHHGSSLFLTGCILANTVLGTMSTYVYNMHIGTAAALYFVLNALCWAFSCAVLNRHFKRQ